MASALDVAVVGAGPAGLAVAIDAALRGLSVAVFERAEDLPDKACGEGVMPAGVRELERLGVLPLIEEGESRPFRGIRYVDADGTQVEGALGGAALAVRRTALVRAMASRARAAGADLRFGCGLVAHRRSSTGMMLETDRGPEAARMLVAADGLASRLRRAEGLEIACSGPHRFGLRRHFRCTPWTDCVEVHLGDGAEAYVTPVSERCVGVAFLWTGADADGDALRAEPSGVTPWGRLERRFPVLMHRLEDAIPDSRVRGAGPFARASRARTSDRFALVGDAAGYVDAITGEGIALSLLSAAALVRVLPDALAKGADRARLAPYEREFRRLFRRYAIMTRAVLAVARRPRLRRSVLRTFRRFPWLFDGVLSAAV